MFTQGLMSDFSSIETLRSRLKSSPSDWGCRLALAEALLEKGAEQQAALLISTAPRGPSRHRGIVAGRPAEFGI